MKAKKVNGNSEHGPAIARMVEDIVGCKWTLTILQLIRQGTCRPGVIERSVDGLTTKVMNERLRKLVDYGILERCAYAEVPPRVEYELTIFGQEFGTILDIIEELQAKYGDETDEAQKSFSRAASD